MTEPDTAFLATLGRSLAVVQHGTRSSLRAAGVLLARWITHPYRSFGLTDLWAEQPKVPRAARRRMAAEGVESAIATNMLAVMDLVAHHAEYPTADRLEVDLWRVVELWRPALVQKPR